MLKPEQETGLAISADMHAVFKILPVGVRGILRVSPVHAGAGITELHRPLHEVYDLFRYSGPLEYELGTPLRMNGLLGPMLMWLMRTLIICPRAQTTYPEL